MWHDALEPNIDLIANIDLVAGAFDQKALARICELPERRFGREFGMQRTMIAGRRGPENFYFHRDNGSNVLAVAHLDTVAMRSARKAHFLQTEAGLVVYSRALDDRLGAYVILELLPKLGITYDALLTVGEESGMSTAEFFKTPKQYDWLIEFDRGGTDVVMYQYENSEVSQMVRKAGAKVGGGSFSDICYLDHLGIKGFNWGVGYRDYHGPRAHAYLDDTFLMVAKYLRFHEQNKGTAMPHYVDDDDFDFGEDGLLVPSTTSRRAKYEADMERLFRTSLQA